MNASIIYIYALCDPDAPEVPRYVGQSIHPAQRLNNHIGSLESGDRSARAEWIRELLNAGRRPVLAILAETGDWYKAEKLEQRYIRRYARSGVLTNTRGNPYRKQSPQGEFTVCGGRNVRWLDRQRKLAAQAAQ